MKLRLLMAFLVAVVMVGMLPQVASANPILIGINSATIPANAGAGTLEAWLQGLIDSYNLFFGASLPPAGLEVFRVNTPPVPNTGVVPAGYPSISVGQTSITIPTDDFNYLILHWGGNQATSTTYQAFYIGGEAPGSSFTFDAPGRNGLSFYDGFGVPEPSSILLVGMGLIGLAIGAKRRLL